MVDGIVDKKIQQMVAKGSATASSTKMKREERVGDGS